MRYKLLTGAFVLLIATPACLEFSPITIKTGKPTPSVVRSGEPFKITYRAEFFDTVLVKEEDMQPDNLALEKIEVIGLEVEKERIYDDTLGYINVWDFTYTFRIIQPEKGGNKVPSFNFIWVEKKAGVTEEETKEVKESQKRETDEVGISYVTSIITPPPLDIRDGTNFVSPIADGAVLRKWAYGVIGFALLLVMFFVFRFVKYPKIRQSEAGQEIGVETADGEVVVDAEPVLAPKKARKKFLRELKKLQDKAQPSEIRLMVRALLLAELRGIIRNSMTENEIYAKLNGLNEKQVKQIGLKYVFVMDLAQRLKRYQEYLDSGQGSIDIAKETAELRVSASCLKFSKRVWYVFFRPPLERGGTCR